MKDYFKEIFELFANCLMILTLALSAHLLLSNVYHYIEVNKSYNYNLNESKTYISFKENVKEIENNINKVDVDNIKDINRRMTALTYKSKTEQCLNEIKTSDFYNLEKNSFKPADIYDYNKTFSSKINSYCTLLLEAEVTDAINKYNIKVNGYDAVKNNLIRARDDLSTDALRLENRLLFNSSYFWTTDTVRNTIYNYTSDVFFTNLSNYSRLTSVIEESSIWYVNEFGGNR
ncbi:unknown [Mycoplasma sp. CAG:611]|nr:hypothetical protein [Mycoplasmatota bacterium]CDA23568.1 unknown [Mycoplasma sp. CAG:611]